MQTFIFKTSKVRQRGRERGNTLDNRSSPTLELWIAKIKAEQALIDAFTIAKKPNGLMMIAVLCCIYQQGAVGSGFPVAM